MPEIFDVTDFNAKQKVAFCTINHLQTAKSHFLVQPDSSEKNVTGTFTATQGALSRTIECTQVATVGTSGGPSGPGVGGIASLVNDTLETFLIAHAGTGGDGGDFAEPGTAGTAASTVLGNDGAVAISPGTGGAAGKAINLAGGSVTWISGNEPERVKGAVS